VNGIDDILKRAAHLQTLRDRASNKHEAEAAARALAALLDKHQLEEAELKTPTAVEGIVETPDEDPLYAEKRTNPWKMYLATTLCKHYGVAVLRGRGRNQREKFFTMIGRPSDIAIVRYMFAWLSIEATCLLNKEARGRGVVYRRSWMFGFVRGIQEQLTAARRAAWAHGTSTALTVLGDRERLAWEHAKTIYGNAKVVDPSPKRAEAAAYYAGRARGLASKLGNADELPSGHRALHPPEETS
jgi:hypothetical protein